MGNVYGIATPLPTPVPYVNGSDTNCPIGVSTTCITTGPISAPGPGDFYPIIWGGLNLLLGATPPSAVGVSFNINGGSAVASQNVPTALLVANATIFMPIILVGVNSGTAWIGGVSTININVLSLTQALTVKAQASIAIVALFRGPDA